MGQVARVSVVVLLTVLALSLAVGTRAATYVTRSPLNIAGNDWLLEFIFKDIVDNTMDDVFSREQRLLSPRESVIEFQIGTTEIDSVGINPFDVLTSTGQGASVFIDRIAPSEYSMPAFVEHRNKPNAGAELKSKLEKAEAAYCGTVKKMGCRSDSQRDPAAALLFLSRPNWRVFMISSDCCSAEMWKSLLKEKFLSPSPYSFQRGIVASNIFIVRTRSRF